MPASFATMKTGEATLSISRTCVLLGAPIWLLPLGEVDVFGARGDLHLGAGRGYPLNRQIQHNYGIMGKCK